MASIKEQLILHEGLELKAYECPSGYTTVGVGRNLDTKGISEDEAMILLDNDISEIKQQLENYDWYKQLDDIRKKVIIDMVFNLGLSGFLKFENTIQCLKDEEYIAAGNEMRNSRWFHQVGQRAERLIEMMQTGEDYKN